MKMRRGKVAGQWVDAVLNDLLVNGPVCGETRLANNRQWVTALHVLTERVAGRQIASTAVGSDAHTEYRYVAAAVVYLEQLELVHVRRACGADPHKANHVESVAIASQEGAALG